MLHPFFLFIALLPVVTAGPSNVITAPQVCINDIECPTTKYCETRYLSFGRYEPSILLSSSCVPRLQKDAPCDNVFGLECQSNLFCSPYPEGESFTCQPKKPLGRPCRLETVRPCLGDLICSRTNSTCQPFSDGFAGDSCVFDRHCQQQSGFYCRSEPQFCAKKKPPGKPCGIAADNYECEGFCAAENSYGEGVCQARQQPGKPCTDSEQCRTVVLPTFRTIDFICNKPDGRRGVCVLETKLLKRLGAPCDPANDRCDERRGLICAHRPQPKNAPRSRNRFVCQQKIPNVDGNFCTPRSKLSQCPTAATPTSCRRQLLQDGKKPAGIFRCLRTLEVIPRGRTCDHKEYAVCKRGLQCRQVPGLRLEQPGGSPPVLRTCKAIARLGQDCSDTFGTLCVEGTFCIRGRCRKAKKAPTQIATRAGFGWDCSKLPCLTGLVCARPEFGSGKSCQLPKRMVKVQSPCYERATFRPICPPGTHCVRDLLKQDVERCRPIGGVDSPCVLDNGCKGKLKCGYLGACFDPAKSLPLGATCNPKAPPSQKRCNLANVKLHGDNFKTTVVLKCLPKKKLFACQRVAGIFEHCSAAENIACEDDTLMCSAYNVCVPRTS